MTHIFHGTMAFILMVIVARNPVILGEIWQSILIGKLEGSGHEIYYNNVSQACYYRSRDNCKEPPPPIGCAKIVKCDPEERAKDTRIMNEADKRARDLMRSSGQMGLFSITNSSNVVVWIALAAWALLALFLALTMMAFFVKWRRKRRAAVMVINGSQQLLQPLDTRSLAMSSFTMAMEEGTIALPTRTQCYTENELIPGDPINAGSIQRVKFNSFVISESLVLKNQKFGSHNSIFVEAALMRSLSHPNVMDCRNLFHHQQNNTFALVMPAMDMDMQQYLKNGSSNKEILLLYDLAHQLASALAYVHSQQIIHADLCAQNCLLSLKPVGQITLKLSDFGLSVRLPTNHVSAIDKRWAPSEVKNSEENGQFHVTFASDIWSFGVTLFEFFTGGAVPYAGIEADQIDLNADSQASPLDHFSSYASEEAKEAVPLAAKMLMLECFRQNAEERIDAQTAGYQLAEKLSDIKKAQRQ